MFPSLPSIRQEGNGQGRLISRPIPILKNILKGRSIKSMHRRSQSGPAFSEDVDEHEKNLGKGNYKASHDLFDHQEGTLSMMRNLYSPKDASNVVVHHPPLKSKVQQTKKKRCITKRMIKRQVHSFHESDNTLLCSMCYHGMEVIFVSKHDTLLILCARTRVAFQKICLGDKIISLAGNTWNGMVVAATSSGLLYIYNPNPNDNLFGRYIWKESSVINSSTVFEVTEVSWSISISRNYLALISNGDRMAVYNILGDVELLWCSSMDANVMHCGISGDGCAIAVVLEGEGEGVPFPYGVRTFIREKEDDVKPNLTLKGIIFKAGPFLVHSCTVTRVKWKGTGCDICNDEYYNGNDYLLTHCENDSSLRVFSQCTFKQLMHWTTPKGSRADFIMGISSANIGDLEDPNNIVKTTEVITIASKH